MSKNLVEPAVLRAASSERRSLLPQPWASLRPGGIMFVDLTPHRYYLLEYHTTGLLFLKYAPDRLALTAARSASARVEQGRRWETPVGA